MDTQTRKKIKDAVLQILKSCDLEVMTEFGVRAATAEKLGLDLSGLDSKKLVRSVVESFLLYEDDVGKDVGEVAREEHDGLATNMQKDVVGERIVCKLSDRRCVAIQDFKGSSWVSIRDYHNNDGKQIPSNQGISLTHSQWSAIRSSLPLIEEAIKKMETKLRSETVDEVLEDVSNSMSSFTTRRLVPIEITRFDGKNYHYWAQQMEIFLKQLKIAYVLTDQCPVASARPEASSSEIARVKAAEQKWINDDYICRRNILSALSDSLFYKYSQKTCTAKDLWEQLRLVYRYEEYGAKRSQVKKYIEFQIVDGRPISEQVQELNNIVDSIVAAGIPVDESFHVGVIISKLPPSWKDFSLKLMHSEHLSFRMLMDGLRVEEELQRQYKCDGPHGLQQSNKLQSSNNGLKNSGVSSKKRESRTVGQPVVCFSCGKKGHFSKHCRNKKIDKES